MVRHFTTALAAALLLGSVGFASAQTFQRYDGVDLPPPERDVLLYAQLTVRQRTPRNKLTLLPLRLGR